jgi:hypothetical protein
MSAFKKLENKLSHEKGVADPAALAASIGRKKYGEKGTAARAAAAKDDTLLPVHAKDAESGVCKVCGKTVAAYREGARLVANAHKPLASSTGYASECGGSFKPVKKSARANDATDKEILAEMKAMYGDRDPRYLAEVKRVRERSAASKRLIEERKAMYGAKDPRVRTGDADPAAQDKIREVMTETFCTASEAQRALRKAHGDVKHAVAVIAKMHQDVMDPAEDELRPVPVKDDHEEEGFEHHAARLPYPVPRDDEDLKPVKAKDGVLGRGAVGDDLLPVGDADDRQTRLDRAKAALRELDRKDKEGPQSGPAKVMRDNERKGWERVLKSGGKAGDAIKRMAADSFYGVTARGPGENARANDAMVKAYGKDDAQSDWRAEMRTKFKAALLREGYTPTEAKEWAAEAAKSGGKVPADVRKALGAAGDLYHVGVKDAAPYARDKAGRWSKVKDVEGYMAGGSFHPIRGSKVYTKKAAGEKRRKHNRKAHDGLLPVPVRRYA